MPLADVEVSRSTSSWSVAECGWKQILPDLPDDVIALLATPVVVTAEALDAAARPAPAVAAVWSRSRSARPVSSRRHRLGASPGRTGAPDSRSCSVILGRDCLLGGSRRHAPGSVVGMTIAHPISRAWLSNGGTGSQNYDEFADDAEITAIIEANPSSALAVEMPHRAPGSLGRTFAESLPGRVRPARRGQARRALLRRSTRSPSSTGSRPRTAPPAYRALVHGRDRSDLHVSAPNPGS